MRRIIVFFALFAFAAGCRQTNDPNLPPGVSFTKAGAGSTYTFNGTTHDTMGMVTNQYTINWTVAADNLTILGRSPARMFLSTSSAVPGMVDTLYLIYEANGDISYHRRNTVSNATWIRLPTSGGAGDSQVLIDSTMGGTHVRSSIVTLFEGTDNIMVAGQSLSSQKVNGQTTSVMGASSSVVNDHAWYAPSIGFATQEVVTTSTAIGRVDSLVLVSYTLK